MESLVIKGEMMKKILQVVMITAIMVGNVPQTEAMPARYYREQLSKFRAKRAELTSPTFGTLSDEQQASLVKEAQNLFDTTKYRSGFAAHEDYKKFVRALEAAQEDGEGIFRGVVEGESEGLTFEDVYFKIEDDEKDKWSNEDEDFTGDEWNNLKHFNDEIVSYLGLITKRLKTPGSEVKMVKDIQFLTRMLDAFVESGLITNEDVKNTIDSKSDDSWGLIQDDLMVVYGKESISLIKDWISDLRGLLARVNEPEEEEEEPLTTEAYIVETEEDFAKNIIPITEKWIREFGEEIKGAAQDILAGRGDFTAFKAKVPEYLASFKSEHAKVRTLFNVMSIPVDADISKDDKAKFNALHAGAAEIMNTFVYLEDELNDIQEVNASKVSSKEDYKSRKKSRESEFEGSIHGVYIDYLRDEISDSQEKFEDISYYDLREIIKDVDTLIKKAK